MREISIIKQNILQYLEYKGISKYEFYQKTGVSNGILSQSNGISEDNILRFLSYYKDINPEWLLTGQGDMLRNGLKKESPPDDVFKELDHLRKENAMQTKIIAGLERENELLREKLEDKSVCATQLAPKVVKPSQELALK